MATRAFESLLDTVAGNAPGCPPPVVITQIRNAAIRACERSTLWRYVTDKFLLLPGVHRYYFNTPDETEVHVLFDAMVNDYPLQRLTLEQALCKYPEWADLYSGEDPEVLWSLTPSGPFNENEYNEELFNGAGDFELPPEIVAKASQPQSICQVTPDQYIVLPLPDNDEPYLVRMFLVLRPRRDAAGMDEAIFNELEDAIVHSALQHLFVMPNVAWHDKELAAYHARQFTFQIAERRARANVGNSRAPMVARSAPFA